jgi:hypothetical protein
MERLSSIVGDPLNDSGFRFAPTNAKGVLLLFVRKIDEFHMYADVTQLVSAAPGLAVHASVP